MVISLEHPLYEERLRDRTRVNGNKLEHEHEEELL